MTHYICSMKSIKKSLVLLFCFISVWVTAQNPFPKLAPVFQDDIVPKVYIQIASDSLNQLFENIFSNHHYPATFIFDNGEERDTVENIGFRLRGNTSRGAQKKSFKISFNTLEAGGDWKGLEKLNLNGQHNDPTVTRSKLGWDLLRNFGVPAPRCNHVELYINNQYVGLYNNIEQIDEEFAESRFGNKDGNLYKCLWPADLAYKGANPDLYKAADNGRRTYDLKTNEEADDYSDLANFIDILNNTPDEDLPCELEAVFNVDSYLKAMIFDIFSANWDGPILNKNNFYLYHNTATGKFEYIPFDIDNTFGIDWFGEDWASRAIYNWAPDGQPRPIYNRIMGIPEYKDRFSFYFNELLSTHLQADSLAAYLYKKRDLLAPFIENDRFYSRDYGFELADFNQAFDSKISVNHVPIGLIEYIEKRIKTAKEQLVINDIAPIINVNYDAFSNTVQLAIRDDEAIQRVETCHILQDNSIVCSTSLGVDNQSVFSSSIAFANNTEVKAIYYLVTDNQGNQSRYPACESLAIVTSNTSAVSLFVNEIMASNQTTIVDEAAEFEDWVEIYNPTEENINLDGLYLSDNPENPDKWAFPNIDIPSKGYLLIWADEDGDQGDLHANFKLSKAGEFIGIFDTEANDFGLIDGFEFGTQQADIAFGRIPDGGENLSTMTPSPNTTNQQTTSTISEELINKIRIYPNPTQNSFMIDIGNTIQQPTKILLQDILGRKYLQLPTHGQAVYTIPTTALRSGVYMVVLDYGKEGEVVKKLVIDN